MNRRAGILAFAVCAGACADACAQAQDEVRVPARIELVERARVEVFAGVPRGMCFVDSGAKFVTLGPEGDLAVWDAGTGAILRRIGVIEPEGWHVLAAGHPRRPLVALSNGSNARKVLLVDLDTGGHRVIEGEGAVAFGTGGWCAVLDGSGRASRVSLFREDPETGEWSLAQRIEVPPEWRRCAHFFHGDSLYVTTPTEHFVVDPAIGSKPVYHEGAVLGFHGDEPLRFSDGLLQVGDGESIPWQFETSQVIRSMRATSITADGRAAWFGIPAFAKEHADTDSDGSGARVHVLNADTPPWPEPPRALDRLSLSELGRFAWSGPNTGTWIETAEGPVELDLSHPCWTAQLTFSPDNKHLAVVGQDWSIVVDAGGRVRRRLARAHSYAPGPIGPEFLITDGSSIARWNAAADFEVFRVGFEGDLGFRVVERPIVDFMLVEGPTAVPLGESSWMVAIRGPTQRLHEGRAIGRFTVEPRSLVALDVGEPPFLTPCELHALRGDRTLVVGRNGPAAMLMSDIPDHSGALWVLDREGAVVAQRLFERQVSCAVESPDRATIAVAVEGTIQIVDTDTLATVHTIEFPAEWIGYLRDDVLLSVAGGILRAVSLDGTRIPIEDPAPRTESRLFALGNDLRSFAVGGCGEARWYDVRIVQDVR